ncbi:MAG: hypothetical protein K8S21_04445 [Gemmatimonadetes bacterium]|nr:hypothetical protein [Gemmatimonadota bacterium]
MIRSDHDEITRSLGSTFRHMLGVQGAESVLEIDIRQEGARFICRDSSGQGVERADERAALRWARQRVLEAMIAARPDLLWLHGAAAGWQGGAVLVAGQRGRGKSTIVTALCDRGASFLSDDILPVDPERLEVIPFPRVPEVRPDPGEEKPASWLLEVAKKEIAVDDRIEGSTLPLRAILLPAAHRGTGLTFERCAPSEALVEIAAGTWNFADHGVRAARALSRLVSAVPVMRIGFRDPAEAAEAIVQWLVRPAESAP